MPKIESVANRGNGDFLPLQPLQLSRFPAIFMFVAPNPGPKTLDGTNTYVVVGENELGYVIDPGPQLEAYVANLSRWLNASHISISSILLTHSHSDHAAGAPALKNLVHARILAARTIDRHLLDALQVDAFIVPDEVLPLGRVLHGIQVLETPGHTHDHVCFYQPDTRILFSGDLILGQGSTLVAAPEGDMAHYLKSLREISVLNIASIAPGHGPVVRQPYDKIQEYIQHRRDREEQIIRVVTMCPLTVSEIVERVYVDIDPSLRELAAESVQAQLDKLEIEGRVERRGHAYRITGGERY